MERGSISAAADRAVPAPGPGLESRMLNCCTRSTRRAARRFTLARGTTPGRSKCMWRIRTATCFGLGPSQCLIDHLIPGQTDLWMSSNKRLELTGGRHTLSRRGYETVNDVLFVGGSCWG